MNPTNYKDERLKFAEFFDMLNGMIFNIETLVDNKNILFDFIVEVFDHANGHGVIITTHLNTKFTIGLDISNNINLIIQGGDRLTSIYRTSFKCDWRPVAAYVLSVMINQEVSPLAFDPLVTIFTGEIMICLLRDMDRHIYSVQIDDPNSLINDLKLYLKEYYDKAYSQFVRRAKISEKGKNYSQDAF